MPSDDAYQAVLVELSKLAEAWRIYREVINRAVSLLNQEVIGFKDRLDKDDAAREKRQAQIDEQFHIVLDTLHSIKRWQLIRVAIEVTAVIVVIAFIIGRSL